MSWYSPLNGPYKGELELATCYFSDDAPVKRIQNNSHRGLALNNTLLLCLPYTLHQTIQTPSASVDISNTGLIPMHDMTTGTLREN